MKPGLRLQLLCLLGVLLSLAFAPLYFTATTFTEVSLERAARRELAATERAQQAEAQLATLRPLASPGARPAAAASRPAPTARRLGQRESQALGRLLGLYMLLVGIALLLAIYYALTRLLVRPLDQLAAAARRVAGGQRGMVVPVLPAAELTSLGHSLHVMTTRLLDEEGSLRNKVEELRRTTEELKHAQEQLVRSERLASVGRLAAGLAHEIGNPIAALLGFEELLLTTPLSPEEQRDFLSRMQRETERISRILRNLLDFARPTQPLSLIGAEEPGNINAALEETFALVRPQKRARGITLVNELPAQLPSVVLGREALVQLLLNLTLNAVDALAERADGELRVTATIEPQRVRLLVSDNGPGVSPLVRERLFEPFATTKDVGEGTGLGLAVCRGLVEGAGGSIQLEQSESEPGARFVVLLPSVELRA